MAVPFFFICSGFFFARGLQKAPDQKQYFLQYERRLIKIYLLWTLISLPLSIYGYWDTYADTPVLFFFVMIRKIFFAGSFGIYWYILAVILSAACIYFFVRIKKTGLMFFLSLVLFLFGVCYDSFRPFLSNIPVFHFLFQSTYVVFSWTNNFLMCGWFYMAIGYLMQKHAIRIRTSLAVMGFVVTTLLKFAEQYAYIAEDALTGSVQLFGENQLKIFQVGQAVFFFLIAIRLKLPALEKYSLTMRQLSATIYYTHFIFLFLIDKNLERNGLVVMLIELLLCIVFYVIVKKINHPRLNILING